MMLTGELKSILASTIQFALDNGVTEGLNTSEEFAAFKQLLFELKAQGVELGIEYQGWFE